MAQSARQALAFSSNQQRSKPLDAARLVNLYPEQPPLGARAPSLTVGQLGSPMKAVLYGTPGLKAAYTLGTGTARAAREALGYFWVLQGQTLYRIASDGTTTACTGDTIPASGSAMMSDNGIQLAVLVGGFTYVVGSTNATSSFRITGGSFLAGTNQMVSVTINAVVVNNAALNWSDSNEATIAALAANINSFTSAPDYTATTNGDTIIIKAATSGAGSNGFGVVIAVAGDVTVSPTSTSMSGGSASATTVTLVNNSNYPAAGASSMDYVDGFTVWSQVVSEGPANNRRWFISQLYDTTSIDALDFATAENTSSDLLRVLVNYREIWLFSKTGISIWTNTGASPFPFQRIPGAILERGSGAALSPAKLDNGVFWLGDDRKVYRANGYQPVRISGHWLEEILRATSTVSDAVGMVYSQGGHDFYVLTFPTLGRTFVFDAATQAWHERQSGTSLTPMPWLVRWIAPAFGKIYAGLDGGSVCELDLDTYADLGLPIRRAATTPPFYPDGKRAIMTAAELECELGGTTVVTLTSIGYAFAFVVGAVGVPGDTFAILVTTKALAVNDTVYIAGAGYFSVSTGGGPGTQFIFFTNTGAAGNAAPGAVIAFGAAVSVPGNLDPKVMLRWSDDGGKTWSNIQTKSIGVVGNTTDRAIWRRLGAFRQRTLEFSCSEPVKQAWYGLRYEATPLLT